MLNETHLEGVPKLLLTAVGLGDMKTVCEGISKIWFFFFSKGMNYFRFIITPAYRHTPEL